MQANTYRHQFTALIHDFCRASNFPPCEIPGEAEDAVAMEADLDGLPFLVTHVLSVAPERLIIECDMGPVPEGRADEVMLQLLQMNYEHGAASDTVLGIDVETGSVCYTFAFDIEGKSGGFLLNVMSYMALHAAEWKKTFFLGSQGGGGASVSMSLVEFLV